MKQWKVIGRGQVGWHADVVNVSSSGGTLETYVAEAVDGALVYDASEADQDAFVRHVMSGPMLSLELEPEGVDRFSADDRAADDRAAAARMIPGLGGGFKTLAVAAQSPSYSGLDKVGLGIYERLLRTIPGMRFGRVQGGKVVWVC